MMTRFAAASLTTVLMAAVAQAAPVLDGSLDAADGYGAAVKTYTDNYVNGSDATGGTNVVSTYFTFDSSYVYGAVKLESGPAAFLGANIYVYSSTQSTNQDSNTPGVYGDGNDVILAGSSGYQFTVNGPPWATAITSYSPGTATYVFNGTDTIEFSINRSLLGNYDQFRFGGQLFAYEFHTGGDRVDGPLVSVVPEPTAVAVASLAAAGLLLRRRRATR
jgi:hypothetical protein